MLNHDPVKVHAFALKFLEVADTTVTEIQNAYAQHDIGVIGGLGHKLKSSAKSVGAFGLADICQKLETAGKASQVQQIEQLLPELTQALQEITLLIAQNTDSQVNSSQT